METAASNMASLLPEVPVEKLSVKAMTLLSLKRTFELFNANHGEPLPDDDAR